MASLTITRPPQGGGPRTTRKHPKAILKGEGGRQLTLPYAPQGANLGGWADEWSTIDRPGRKPLVVRNGAGLKTLSIDVLLAGTDHQSPVELLLAPLRRMAESGDRITIIGLSPFERGPWRLETVNIAATLRQQGTNNITRAAVALSFVEASDARPRLGPVSGGKKGGGVGFSSVSARHYTVRKGDTLRSIAAKFYSDPSEWKRIARANHIKDPGKLKVGTRLRIPADTDKKE